MEEKSFGEKIAELRKEKMLSQKELGDILGVSNKAVSKWETGEAVPQMKTVLKISDYFSVDANELVTGTKYDAAKQRQSEINSQAVNALQNENEKLRMDLAGAKKSKRKIASISAVVCALCLMVALVIALSSVEKDNINEGIKDLGGENTSIEFMGEVFVPISEFEKQVFNYDTTYYYSTQKKAVFVNSKGEKEDIIILLAGTDKFIQVKQKGNSFYYINEKNKLSLSRDNVSKIVIVRADAVGENPRGRALSDSQTDAFFEYYALREAPENKAEIFKEWTKDNLYNVNVLFDDEDVSGFTQVGNIFCDEDRNWYFFDLVEGTVCEIGGEIVE